jgi:acetyl esterase/lipase
MLRLASIAAAQRCYIDPVWSAGENITTFNLTYGSAFNNYTEQQQLLLLDVYEARNDARSARPAVVLIHGGSFIHNNKSIYPITATAAVLVRVGYVVVSIDYRLTGAFWGVQPPGTCCPGNNSDAYAFDAAHDAKAAVRWLRAHASKWRIDPTRIAVGGTSAGAIAALFVGYVDVGEGSSGNPGWPSDVRAVMPISGGLRFRFFCAGLDAAGEAYGCRSGSWDHVADIARASQPQLIAVHGTNDTTVPLRQALDDDARARAVRLPSTLVALAGGGHVPTDQFLSNRSAVEATLRALAEAMDAEHAECPHRDV